MKKLVFVIMTMFAFSAMANEEATPPPADHQGVGEAPAPNQPESPKKEKKSKKKKKKAH